jgi:hypothetical protein
MPGCDPLEPLYPFLIPPHFVRLQRALCDRGTL